MITLHRPFIILTGGLLLLHCATAEPYPEDWSQPVAVATGHCADISGTFLNACDSTRSDDRHCLESGGLAGLLFAEYAGAFHERLGSADRVVISQPSEYRLHVEAWKDLKLVREDEIELEPDACTDDGIVIRTGLEATQIEGGIGTGSSRAVIAKSGDGALIARTKVRFTGVWFIVPVSGSSQDWLRFDLVADEKSDLRRDRQP